MRATLLRWLGLLCTGWLALAGPMGVQAQGNVGALVQGGDPPNLFLLYTGDVIGYIEPCG